MTVMLDRLEAIKAMLNGEKVTILHCTEKEYCYYDKTREYPFRYKSAQQEHCEPMEQMWGALYWQIYNEEEPVKYIKMWQWAYMDTDGKIQNTGEYFRSEEEVETIILDACFIAKLDYTEIEINSSLFKQRKAND